MSICLKTVYTAWIFTAVSFQGHVQHWDDERDTALDYCLRSHETSLSLACT